MNPHALFYIIVFSAVGVLTLIGYLVCRWRDNNPSYNGFPPSRCDPPMPRCKPPLKPTPPPPPPKRRFEGQYAALLTYVQRVKGRYLGDGEIEIITALARDGSRKEEDEKQ